MTATPIARLGPFGEPVWPPLQAVTPTALRRPDPLLLRQPLRAAAAAWTRRDPGRDPVAELVRLWYAVDGSASAGPVEPPHRGHGPAGSTVHVAAAPGRLGALRRRLAAALEAYPGVEVIEPDPVRHGELVVEVDDDRVTELGELLAPLVGGLVVDRRPPFSATLGHGLSWDQRPDDGTHPGWLRCRVVAEALTAADHLGGSLIDHAMTTFAAHHLDATAPHLRACAPDLPCATCARRTAGPGAEWAADVPTCASHPGT